MELLPYYFRKAVSQSTLAVQPTLRMPLGRMQLHTVLAAIRPIGGIAPAF
jgi:hypothetical protein